jgi:anaerobic selenocysteine-containing dehydrogenase
MPTLPSTCPLDCPDRCSLSVQVEGDRVTRIGGSRAWEWTDGYICKKVAGFGQRVHGPDRVLHPMVRAADGSFQRVGWEQAMDLIAGRLRQIIEQDGPQAILPVWYAGSNGLLTGGGLDQRLWNRLGVTQCQRTLCAANTGAGARAVYGTMPSADLRDVEHAGAVIVWGNNPQASGIHLLPPLKRLQARGGRLAVVDPRATGLARSADLHLPVLPGADVPVALALIHVAVVEGLADLDFLHGQCEGWQALREEALRWTPSRAGREAGVEPAAIEALAHLYAQGAPALIRCGWGLERTRNGTDAVRAILMLPAVYGKLGVRGGGYVLSTSAGYRMDSRAWQGSSAARAINLSRLGAELEQAKDPPIRACWVYDCNPAVTVPDQARVVAELSRPDRFVVVHEQVWTDTCDLADVVLPATTFLEHKELSRAYSGYVLQWSEPVIPPVGESRSNHQVLADLARRLGVPDEVTEEDLAAQILATRPQGPSFEELREVRAVSWTAPVQMVDVRPEAPIQLSPPPRHLPPPVDADLPLILISPATTRAISSTLYERETAVSVELHPTDAAARGIGDGDRVRLSNPRGEVITTARLTDELRPGVCMLPKGLWRRATQNGWTSNVLIPDHVDARGGGACYNDARVEVERI